MPSESMPTRISETNVFMVLDVSLAAACAGVFVMSSEVACRAVALCEGWETSLNVSEIARDSSTPLGMTKWIFLGAILALIHNLATHDRHFGARFQNFRFCNFHDVLREHSEIGELADFDRAFVFFLEGGVSR